MRFQARFSDSSPAARQHWSRTLFSAFSLSSLPALSASHGKSPALRKISGQQDLFAECIFWFCCSSRFSIHATHTNTWAAEAAAAAATPTTGSSGFLRFVLFICFSPIEGYSSLPPKFSGALFLCVDLLRFCFDFQLLVVSGPSGGFPPDFRPISTDRTGPKNRTTEESGKWSWARASSLSSLVSSVSSVSLALDSPHFRFQLGLIKQTIDHIDLFGGLRCAFRVFFFFACLPGLLLAFHFPVLVSVYIFFFFRSFA